MVHSQAIMTKINQITDRNHIFRITDSDLDYTTDNIDYYGMRIDQDLQYTDEGQFFTQLTANICDEPSWQFAVY